MEGKAYGRDRREWRFTRSTSARPEDVYDLLADLRTHTEWGGKRQFRSFRLLSLDGPEGPAQSGTEFTSTGRIPMNRARWDNRNTVTKADRPRLIEITTEGSIAWPNRAAGNGTFINRFEIEPRGDGSVVTYVVKQLRFRNPPWGLRYPLLRNITYRVWTPIWFARGFRNLLRMAEERAASSAAGRNDARSTSS